MRPVRSLLVLIAAVLALAGCQGKAQREACPAAERCLAYGNDSEPLTLDPGKANLTTEQNDIGDLIVGLTTDGPDATPVPAMARTWEVSADGLVWTFHLRDAQWSDGVPVTAGDFVYGLRRTLDPKTASIYAYLLYVLKNGQAVNEGKAPLSALGASAPDPHTVRIELAHPAPYLLELTKHQSFFPAPKHAVERWGDAWVKPGHYVSNGPFVLTSWRLGDHITLTKNPRFYDAANVCLDRVDVFSASDMVSAERRVARGELDLTTRFQSNRYERLKRVMPGVPRTNVALATSYLSFNTRDRAAFKDIRVRRALSEAIDRDFITGKLLRAGQQSAYAFVPPIVAHYVSHGPQAPWAGKTFAARQAEARALLAAAGYGPARPLRFTMLVASSTDTLLLTEAIQADWAAIGVRADIRQSDPQVSFADYRNRNFDVGVMSWFGDFNDPMTFLGLMKSDTGAQNYGDYKSPAYDALLEAADHEPDAGKRAEILARAEARLLADEGTVPLYFAVNRALVSPRVSGWQGNPPDVHRLRWMCLKGSS
jgi:oligopeptide transport system substrate-binding protein